MSLIDDIADDFRWPAELTWHGQDPVPLAAAMEQAGVPAVSVATITDGEVSDAAACGLTCAGESMMATQDTLFQAASISKPVAAATALRLVADGRLDLDESIAGRLRCWQVPANDSWQPRLTIRQLLSHTAGLTVHGFPGYQPGAALPSLPDVLAGRGNTLAVAHPGPASPAAASLPDQAGRPGAAAADPGTEALAADDETAALAGDYAAGGVVIRIRKRAGRLTLQAGHQPPVGLFPAGPHRWEARELNLGIQLKQCAAGEPQPALILHQAAQYTTDTELIRRDPAA